MRAIIAPFLGLINKSMCRNYIFSIYIVIQTLPLHPSSNVSKKQMGFPCNKIKRRATKSFYQ